ncbi:baseplate hub [Pseudomonas phage PspYZU05]|uniref:Baseplate hub subunit n=1 Tax=Pseudomonas phage PspYZU05 TaxID=1983556 RepID=A0A2U7NF54_9CAUD|nr:baseplate hub [Pseudomonas phage PspYZU05]ASD52101.1 baseplate hub subunit [Pseudomonas phage PspYZU05]
MKPFSLRTYKDLLKAKAAGDMEFEKAISALVPNMPKHKAEVYLIKLWNLSLAPEPMVKMTCACGQEHYVKPNFNNVQHEDESELVYPLGNFKLVLRYPTLLESKNKIDMVLNCIDYLDTNGQSLKMSELSEEEQDHFCSLISEQDIDNISELLLKPKVVLGTPVKCCQPLVHVISGFKEFFKLM